MSCLAWIFHKNYTINKKQVIECMLDLYRMNKWHLLFWVWIYLLFTLHLLLFPSHLGVGQSLTQWLYFWELRNRSLLHEERSSMYLQTWSPSSPSSLWFSPCTLPALELLLLPEKAFPSPPVSTHSEHLPGVRNSQLYQGHSLFSPLSKALSILHSYLVLKA